MKSKTCQLHVMLTWLALTWPVVGNKFFTAGGDIQWGMATGQWVRPVLLTALYAARLVAKKNIFFWIIVSKPWNFALLPARGPSISNLLSQRCFGHLTRLRPRSATAKFLISSYVTRQTPVRTRTNPGRNVYLRDANNMCLFLVHSKRARFHPIPQSIHLTAEARNGIGRSSANKCLKFVRIPQENGTTIRWNCETVSLLHYLVTLLSQAGFLPHANKTAVLTNEPNHHSIYSCLLGKGLLFGNIIISQKWWSCTSTAQRSKLHHGDAAGIRSIFR